MVFTGGIHLQQSVDGADTEAGHELPGCQALELGAQVRDGAEVGQAGMVGQIGLVRLTVRLEGGDRGAPGDVGGRLLEYDLLLSPGSVVVNGVHPGVHPGLQPPAPQPLLQLLVALLYHHQTVVVQDGVDGAGPRHGARPVRAGRPDRGRGP